MIRINSLVNNNLKLQAMKTMNEKRHMLQLGFILSINNEKKYYYYHKKSRNDNNYFQIIFYSRIIFIRKY